MSVSFVQGYAKGSIVARAAWHGVADVFTLSLWEVVGTPTELIFGGDIVAYQVTYDDKDCVDNVVMLIQGKGKDWDKDKDKNKELSLRSEESNP